MNLILYDHNACQEIKSHGIRILKRPAISMSWISGFMGCGQWNGLSWVSEIYADCIICINSYAVYSSNFPELDVSLSKKHTRYDKIHFLGNTISCMFSLGMLYLFLALAAMSCTGVVTRRKLNK